MKKVLSILLVAVAFVGCEREVNVDITVPPCEDGNCEGAIIKLAPQARGPVNRGDMYAWIDVITVVATDDQGVDYGNEFELVDDNSGEDGFYLTSVPTNEIIDFDASSTSVLNLDQGNQLNNATDSQTIESIAANYSVYAEYQTENTVSQLINYGENIVSLDMTTNNGRLVSRFSKANSLQDYHSVLLELDVDNDGSYDESVYFGGPGGMAPVAYSVWNDATAVSGSERSFKCTVYDTNNGTVVYTRDNITETIVASTSISNEYVVGLDFVQLSEVEVLFSWQVWNDQTGTDETEDTTSPNGLDCSSCGAVTDMNFPGSYSLSGDSVWEDVNLVIAGDLNLNGHTLTVTCGNVTVSGNFNGGGTLIAAGDLIVTGATQNNPTIHVNECL